MPQNTVRRRRGGSQSTQSQTTADPTSGRHSSSSATSQDTSPSNPAKSVPQLLEEESSSFRLFLALAGLACLFFVNMLQNTKLPGPGRVHAVIIDAGSTGTRAQVFSFHSDDQGRNLVLKNTVMFSQNNSIDALSTAPSSAANRFLKPLLDKVAKAIPGIRRRKKTPIALHATAGLRLLGHESAERALEMARSVLNTTEFLFKPEWVSILSESDEANHAWVTTNYLLRNFDSQKENNFVGALDLGGGSMQVVFDDHENIDKSILTPEDDEAEAEKIKVHGKYPAMKTSVTVFGKTYLLHSRNHLGLGLVNFKKMLYHIFDSEGVLEEGNPCFRKGSTFKDKRVQLKTPISKETSATVTIIGDGNFDRCVASAEIVISSFSRLEDKRSRLPDGKSFFAFANFYDKTVKLGMGLKATKLDMIKKGEELCETEINSNSKHRMDDACAEFSFIYAVMKILTENFSESKSDITFEQYVDGHMLGWALGVALDMLQPNVISDQVSIDTKSLLMV